MGAGAIMANRLQASLRPLRRRRPTQPTPHAQRRCATVCGTWGTSSIAWKGSAVPPTTPPTQTRAKGRGRASSPTWRRWAVRWGGRVGEECSRSVVVVDTGARIAGVVKGIDADGALLLETTGRTIRILTGDVSIEGAYD